MKPIHTLLHACLLLTATALNSQTTPTHGHTPRKVYNLNFDWKFHRGDTAGAQAIHFDDRTWEPVHLPHDFQIHQPWVAPAAGEQADLNNPIANIRSRLSARGFKEMGCGWYRHTFTPDDAWSGRRVLLDFEGILLTGDAFLNGTRIGGTDYGYLGFEADITALLRYGQENVIAVKADTGQPDNSRWYTGGGLYRDVHITVTDARQYFTRHPLAITTPVVHKERASVVVRGEIATRVKTDSIRVGITVCAPDGTPIYNKVGPHWVHPRQHVREHMLDSLTLPHPLLWDCEHPHLYTLTATLYRPDGTVADSVSERFGIRTLDYSPKYGLRLNGRKVVLRGIANHHTLGALGAAAYPGPSRNVYSCSNHSG